MPFETLPGSQGRLDLSPLKSYRGVVVPPRPTFPTYKVVMDALEKILPALDPVERAKRKLILESIPLERAKMAAEMQRLPMQKRAAENALKIQEKQLQKLDEESERKNKLIQWMNEAYASPDTTPPLLKKPTALNDVVADPLGGLANANIPEEEPYG